jgi:hypothetical protein
VTRAPVSGSGAVPTEMAQWLWPGACATGRNNYYAARLDLEARDFILYKFNRVQMEEVGYLRLDEKGWHELTTRTTANVTVATERDRALTAEGMFRVRLSS